MGIENTGECRKNVRGIVKIIKAIIESERYGYLSLED